jgi:HEAT repeat protein
MAYVPPPPGSTTPGQPTPEGVHKQAVNINDLPPEVRKSFLLSMVFFPTLVGATICAVIFLGWWTLFENKKPEQFAKELLSTDARRRKVAQRELAEKLGDKAIYSTVTLNALIDMVNNPELDKEAEQWSPQTMITGDELRASPRWWAAAMAGHFAAKLPDAADKTRAREALIKALKEKNLGIFAARGLSLMRDPQARDALVERLENGDDVAIKTAATSALGAIGEYVIALGAGLESTNEADRKYAAEKLTESGIKPEKAAVEAALNSYREPLQKAFKESSTAEVKDNAAIALARLRDPLGKEHLTSLTKSEDAVIRDHAQRALKALAGEPLSPPGATKAL